MIYLSQMLGISVVDIAGQKLGTVSDLAISAGEVFPRITSVAFRGPDKTPFMISWRKYVALFDTDTITLNVSTTDVRFSYLQSDEILVARDLMNKQIVDTQGLKIVRVNDIKLSVSHNQLRLLGAEVGSRGLLRALSPHLEDAVMAVSKFFDHPLEEKIIAWNYMDLLDRDLSEVKLSVTHRRLHELHPADIADILEQLDPQQRASMFEHLDNAQAAETISELEDEYQADVLGDLAESRASQVLAQMDPDDAADIVGDLPYHKAEQLLRLMGVEEEKAIRALLGYQEHTAGGIMTSEFLAVDESTTVDETIELMRALDEDHEPVHYVYTTTPGDTPDAPPHLTGVVSMRKLVLARNDDRLGKLAFHDLLTANPDDDQEETAETISKYDLLALPVVDEDGGLLGIVTVDDAFDVLEEEHDEDLALAGASRDDDESNTWMVFFKWFMRREIWFALWVATIVFSALTGHLTAWMGALLFMPLVLLVADDVATYAINDLIDDDEAQASLLPLLVRDASVGAVVGLIAISICAAAVGILSNANALGSGNSETTASVINAIVPTALTILLTLVAGVLLADFARRRKKKGRVVSNAGMATVMMLCAIILQILTSVAATAVVGLGA
jgi:magnesium transporter